MEIAQIDVWISALAGSVMLASCTVWLILLVRRSEGQPILKYEPRHPVPWGSMGMALALLVALLPLSEAFAERDPDPLRNMDPSEMAQRLALGSLQPLILTTAFFAIVATFSSATWTDLGIGYRGLVDLASDCRIGFVAWLAALAPVYTLQAILVSALQPESGHPLIEMILENPSPLLLGIGFVAAVFVAPICEEITFRLFLQGYLERWEDGRPETPATGPRGDDAETHGPSSGAATELPWSQREVDPDFAQDPSPSPSSGRPARGIFGAPHGWLPICGSSLLFALAHVGNGPDPIPLFLLALVLGYIYQRTHRILPCIVTHMLFNLFSLCALMVYILRMQGGDMQ